MATQAGSGDREDARIQRLLGEEFVSLSSTLAEMARQLHVPFPPPGDLPDPGIEPESPVSPALEVDSLPLSQINGLSKKKNIF